MNAPAQRERPWHRRAGDTGIGRLFLGQTSGQMVQEEGVGDRAELDQSLPLGCQPRGPVLGHPCTEHRTDEKQAA